MQVAEMVKQCAEAIAQDVNAHVTFVVPKGSMPGRFPRGELLNECMRNGVVERTYRFKAARVIAFLVAIGAVEVQRTGDKTLSFKVLQ